MCGNFAKVTKKRPKNWFDVGYKMFVPFPFRWRVTIGKVTCDCKEVKECYQPYYGWDWYHEDSCALIKLVEARPQLKNLWCYQELPHIASSD